MMSKLFGRSSPSTLIRPLIQTQKRWGSFQSHFPKKEIGQSDKEAAIEAHKAKDPKSTKNTSYFTSAKIREDAIEVYKGGSTKKFDQKVSFDRAIKTREDKSTGKISVMSKHGKGTASISQWTDPKRPSPSDQQRVHRHGEVFK